jgi:hypothetical protein
VRKLQSIQLRVNASDLTFWSLEDVDGTKEVSSYSATMDIVQRQYVCCCGPRMSEAVDFVDFVYMTAGICVRDDVARPEKVQGRKFSIIKIGTSQSLDLIKQSISCMHTALYESRHCYIQSTATNCE